MDAKISTLDNPAKNITQFTSVGDLINTKFQGGAINILNLVFIFIGIYFFASLVIAGWAFMMSSGDAKKASAAAGNITNAFAGLIMAFTAFLIVRIITTALGIANPF